MAGRSQSDRSPVEQAQDDAETAGIDTPHVVGDHAESQIFKSAQWSADGTCIVTNSEDNTLRTFVLPTDLLTATNKHVLQPYTRITSPEPVTAACLYPFFDLADPNTTLLLSSIKDHPIRLHNALQPQQIASYPLIKTTTEAYICPNSLLFTPSGTHFVAGSKNLLSCFDISRPGQEPLESYPTVPSRRSQRWPGEAGMTGIIGALSVSNDGILAAGTFSRDVGLYSDEGMGECISSFTISDKLEQAPNYSGAGITQTAWSPDGRYLYIAERMSDAVLVYDIRVEGKLLGQLTGRKAMTQQRMSLDVVATSAGHEIWAGGTDGVVRMWKDPHLSEGSLSAAFGWAAHGDAISSAAVHPSGCVVATCSGSRPTNVLDMNRPREDEVNAEQISDESDGEGSLATGLAYSSPKPEDCSLRLWSV